LIKNEWRHPLLTIDTAFSLPNAQTNN